MVVVRCNEEITVSDFCDHIQKLILFMEVNDLDVCGCGCCGSPVLICNTCDIEYEYFDLEDILK